MIAGPPPQDALSRRLIVALDFADPAAAMALIRDLGGLGLTYKIGLELIYAGGLDLAANLIADGQPVFIDAKLLDIPNTVERAAASIASLGASFLTVHGTDRKTLDAAMRGRGSSKTKLLAVTVLTSLEAADLKQQGIAASPEDMVLNRARLAVEAGFDGVVASAQEAGTLRQVLGPDILIVTPGIRPAGADIGDQARVTTPKDALRAGVNYLVVGRPITAAADPRAAAEAILAEVIAAKGA